MTADRRERIKEHAANFNARVAAIRADPTLSDLGKRRALKELFTTTKSTVDPLRAEIAEHEDSSRREVERRLFGLPRGATPSDVIDFRDAQDRVAGIKSPEALGELMEHAAGTGDEGLLRAAARHAWTQSRSPLSSDNWAALVAEYGRQRPAYQGDLERFAEMNSSPGKTAMVIEQMSMAIREPKELSIPEGQVSDLAPTPAERPPGLFRG